MTTWLTQDAYDRLSQEYDQLSGPTRADITKKIAAAREEGDLKENGGYHAAKEEQGKTEARIKQLRQILDTAQVGEAPSADGSVQVGHVVSVTFVGDPADGQSGAAAPTEIFLLGSREQAADHDLEVYSPQSPLGAAVLGAKVGATVSYMLPSEKTLSVRVDASEPFAG
jgi:transcription elongation factor GreA